MNENEIFEIEEISEEEYRRVVDDFNEYLGNIYGED